MPNLSKKIRYNLYEALKKENNAFGDANEHDGIITFLEKVWDLRLLESTDERRGYNKDFYQDVWQHMVNNKDWSYDDLFIERLDLLNDEKAYGKFIQTIVDPQIRNNEEETLHFYHLINSFLEKENYKLAVEDYDEYGRNLYAIKESSEVEDLPYNVRLNQLPFFVSKDPSLSYHTKPEELPSFVLDFDGWDDFGHKNRFSLFFYDESGEDFYIGKVKLMHDGDTATTEIVDEYFNRLPDSFCSLGQSIDYYQNLKDTFSKNFEAILFALRDAAFFPKIQEKFEKKDEFNTSLIRTDNAERLFREAKYEIYGHDLNNLYSFSYNFEPLFSDTPIQIDFSFDEKVNFPNRIMAIIGKNGTGKTQLISSLPLDFARENISKFDPHLPIFSKVIAVSYSVFDNFEVPSKTAAFNYEYCGLRKKDGDIISSSGLKNRFHSTREKIQTQGRVDRWRKILSNFLDEDIIEDFFQLREDPFVDINADQYKTSLESFHQVTDRLSSGQSIILYIISEIVANIRLDTLLLYDEPETHLHPNAITKLMNSIFELVDEFQSYCIMTTHSPLIIRELHSKNVFVIEKNENIPSIRRIEIESFGENLTTLTEEVFGNKEVPKQYKRTIENLVGEGKSYMDIIEVLEYDEMPLSLNSRILIKSLIKSRDEEY